MKKKFTSFLIVAIFLMTGTQLFAQNAIPANNIQRQNFKTSRVAIFSPMYLDSAFSGTTYRFGKRFPKFAGPGLEFVNGAMLALDSMKVYGGNIFATIYDSKSTTDPVQSLIDRHMLDSVNLIIGNVKDEEFQLLANFSAKHRIPFISATYPNDGGITNNPFLVILNSTLKAHVEAVYATLLQAHANKNIIFLKKDGKQEDAILEFFKNIDRQDGKSLLKYKVVDLGTEEDFTGLEAAIDTLRENIIYGATLNLPFAQQIIDKAVSLHQASNKITLIGMPNWDELSQRVGKKHKDFPYYFTTTFYVNKNTGPAVMMQNFFKRKYNNHPSEMAYRGYESVFIFSRLLTRYPDDFMNHLNDYAYKVFTEYTILPATLKSGFSIMPDYFENRRIYFLQSMNGAVNKTWN